MRIVNHKDYPDSGSNSGGEEPPLGPSAVPAALAPYLGFLVFAAFVRAQRIAVSALQGTIHPRMVVVLSAIDEQPMSQGELGARLDLGRTTMVGIVDALEARGFVERRRDPADRRAYHLAVTEQGVETLAALRPILRGCEDELLEPLSPPERRRLNDLLRATLESLGDTRLPASLVERPGFLIARAHFRTREIFERGLEPAGIQPRHFGLLAVCAHSPGSQRSIARELGVSDTIVGELIDALEDRGLAERRPNALDRRSYIVVPTNAGQAALEQARGALADLERRIADTIGTDALADLTTLLRRVLGAR